ncbi:DUF5131 family protein [Paracoccus mutanolyticus]|uniref:DUF5131 family protein n=1 Tax=Paracoccus mutanolyticus TaxID=1499308 RepID=UPI001CB90066|nr:DUF5131 family protein [Paracoccus mutanolyticus]
MLCLGVEQPAIGTADAKRTERLFQIVGLEQHGKAGDGAMHPDWARSLRDQCQAAGVAFHFKQWGEYGPYRSPGAIGARFVADRCETVWQRGSAEADVWRVGKKAAGRWHGQVL